MNIRIIRTVSETVVEAVAVGAWVAAGELRPARRRLARSGVVAGLVATAAPQLRGAAAQLRDTAEQVRDAVPEVAEPSDDLTPPDAPKRDARRLAVIGVAVGLSAALALGQRRLEKRWLNSLIPKGYAHPHRALGVRMAALTLAGTLPGRLLEAQQKHEADRR
jgi:hypothetical protein